MYVKKFVLSANALFLASSVLRRLAEPSVDPTLIQSVLGVMICCLIKIFFNSSKFQNWFLISGKKKLLSEKEGFVQ